MEGPGASASTKQPFQAILNSAQLLQERLEQLIDFTRPIDCGHASVSASQVIEQIASLLATRARGQKVKMDVSTSNDVPMLVMNPDHLLSILLPLATNGLDALENGGTLSMSAVYLSGEKMVEFQIRDTGAGISATDLKEMGRPFFTTRPAKVGLGVPNAKRLAQAYGGDVLYESRPGKGTIVKVRLPIERTGV
jgi:signal transduction histidine kinase